MKDETARAFAGEFGTREIAFAPSTSDSGAMWRLSISERDILGHIPISPLLAWGSADEMQVHADDLNERVLGLARPMARAIVASSMGIKP